MPLTLQCHIRSNYCYKINFSSDVAYMLVGGKSVRSRAAAKRIHANMASVQLALSALELGTQATIISVFFNSK